MKKTILTLGLFLSMVALTSFTEPTTTKTEKVTISKITTEIGGLTGVRG